VASLSRRAIFEQLTVGRLAKNPSPVVESKFSHMPGNEPCIKSQAIPHGNVLTTYLQNCFQCPRIRPYDGRNG
jgi:hypothetical protein